MNDEEKKVLVEEITPAIQEVIRREFEAQMHNFKAELNGNMSITHKQPEPDKYTKTSNYLQVLIAAKHAGHNVNQEINEALQELRKLVVQ